jgi:DNA-binding NarL/FixJ family response regulator
MAIRVFVADDHPLVRDGVRFALQRESPGIVVVGEATNGADVLDRAEQGGVDVYVLDVTMPRLNGVETARRLKRVAPDAHVVLLTMHSSRRLVADAMAVGVLGYVLKDAMAGELTKAIRHAYEGKEYLGMGVPAPAPSVSRRRGESSLALSEREAEVLQLIAEGLAGKEIADRLALTLNTVNVHRRNIMQKLGMHKETELVRYAINEGRAKL